MTTAAWPILADPFTADVPVVVVSESGTETPAIQAFLGSGIIRPFRRDQKVDIANAQGVRLIQSAVGEILGTNAQSEFTQGELPWRPEFGSLLYLLRLKLNSEALTEIARTYVVQALTRWEPRIRVTTVRLSRQETPNGGLEKLVIRVRYDIVDRNTPGNQVLVAGLETSVGLAA